MIERNIPLPKVWDKNMNYIGEIRPIKVSATLKMVPLSYASLQLSKGVNVPARGFVELFSSMGSLGIFRVRSPQDAYGDDITTAELEHAITEVGDYLVLGSYDQMMPANQAFTTIFSHYRGSHWQLGSVAALGTGEIAVQADHVRVLECLISLLEQKTDCMMAFDFSTTPWTLNFVKRDTVVSAEGRLARNVNYAKVSYDDTELCTRAYFQVSATEEADPSGFPSFDQTLNYSVGAFVAYGGKLYRLPAGHTSGVTWENTQKTLVNDVPSTTWQYVDADTIGTYGIVEKEVYSGGEYTDTEVLRIVQDFLNKHKEPRVSVEISAEELSSITGESFDTFTIGKLCRLALVDYGVTIERTITGLSWDNVYGAPLDITVNLEDEEDTAINFLHDIDTNGGTIGGSGGGGGGGGGKKKQEDVWKEYRTKFQQTDYYFDLNAARYNRAEDILQQAGLYIDSNGTLIYAQDNERNFGSKLKVESDRISLVVEGTGANAHVKPASIISAIVDNDGELSSEIRVSADRIYLLGQTIADTITADFIQTRVNSMTSLRAKKISIGSGGNLSFEGNSATITDSIAANLISNLKITLTGNTYKLQKVTVGDASWTDVGSFSRAVSSWSVGGGSGKVNVTANPQAQKKSVPVSIGGSNNITRNGTYTYKVYYENASGDDVETGASMRVTVNVSTSDRYNEGWNDCIETIKHGYGHTVLTGFSTYSSSRTNLYVAPTGGASIATGSAQIWRYGGTTATRYTLPDKK